ncbi:MAG: CBS domain-containing protein [Planctomycetota bacterium]
MSASIGTTRVSEVMVTNVITVKTADKMEEVARLFEQQDINAAPVVDSSGRCLGIITNHDIAEYESTRVDLENECRHGVSFDLARYGIGTIPRLPGRNFDDVGFHMTKHLVTAAADDGLSRVAESMCRQHIHHVIVLDEEKRVRGMLSALDILGQILGVPVCRQAKCPVD